MHPSGSVLSNPCEGCPCQGKTKVPPTQLSTPKVQVVGLAPGGEEEEGLRLFIGPSGQLLRQGLRAAGFDPETEVSYANVTRCRPLGDDFEARTWTEAAARCWNFLQRDLAANTAPLLLLGAPALKRFLNKKDAKIGAHRGLWTPTIVREAFVAHHPAHILRAKDPAQRATLREQFMRDLSHMGDRIFKRQRADDLRLKIYPNLDAARPLLDKLAIYRGFWTFDIETYDAQALPSRPKVATDPCHPDFRVRGLALSWAHHTGAWLEFLDWETRKPEARALLNPLFLSPAPKGAFAGHFDEEGLIYPGWVDGIENRTSDAMLALVALGDARHESLRLEKAVIDVLKIPPSWDAVDKSRIREYPMEQIARGSVGDACRTYTLCLSLEERLAQEVYL